MKTDDELRTAMSEEAQRIETWARLWDEAYRKDAMRWTHINGLLVVTAGILAALSASTGLTKTVGVTVAGVLALAAAIVSAVTTGLRPANYATQFNTSAAANSGLADGARVFRTTIVDHRPIAAVTTEFQKLCERRDAAVNNAPVARAPWRRYRTPRTLPSAWPPGQDPGDRPATTPRARRGR